MSIHISAGPADIAKTVFIPGDPLRAESFAKEFLPDARLVNRVRNALTYTGTYRGKQVTFHGTNIGLSNQNIYCTELMKEYGVRRIIRIGTCGAIQSGFHLGDIILASSASTDSGMNTERFRGLHYSPTASFFLLEEAYQKAKRLSIEVSVGQVFATDRFYKEENPDWWKCLAPYGVLALEMETSELYTLAAFYKVEALSILTVSDIVPTMEKMDAATREHGVSTMMKLALELAL